MTYGCGVGNWMGKSDMPRWRGFRADRESQDMGPGQGCSREDTVHGWMAMWRRVRASPAAPDCPPWGTSPGTRDSS